MASPHPYRLAAPLLIVALALAAPAHADQFKQAADGGTIDCAVSAHELTRFALIGDEFASVSKISSGYPYNDFAVTNEPVRGDIYVSVPETFAAARISFFATTRAGYVYKFACAIETIEANQVFITNPAIALGNAAHWEAKTTLPESALRLIRAMAIGGDPEGFTVRQLAKPPVRAGALDVQLIARYRGAALAGKVIRLVNRGHQPIHLAEHDLAPAGALAVAIAQAGLAPGEATTAYVVEPNGERVND